MIQILFIILSVIINISISSRRLLQTIGGNPVNPALPQLPSNNVPVIPFNPAQFPLPPPVPTYITGYYGQQCLAITPDMACKIVGQTITDAGTGTVECSVASSCCACQTVLCGYNGPGGRYCDNIKVGAPNALYGVQQVAIAGQAQGSGAVMDCGGRGSCANTHIIGEWVNTMICGGPDSCRDSVFEFAFSKGLVCSTRACIGASFTLLTNLGGAISCDGPEACMNSVMNIAGNIQNIKCGGRRGCKDTKITLTNPMEHFHLTCGPQGCEGLTLDLIITGTAATTGCLGIPPDFIEWKGITCGSNGACVGLTLNVINNGCRPVRIEDFHCMAGQSCTGSNFNFNAGSSPYPLALQNCHCGLSCNQATGIDLCFNNIHVLECLNAGSCVDQQLTNIANGFMLLCPNTGSCKDLYLNIAVYGASQNIIQRISLFDCSGMVACQGLTVDISNMQLSLTGVPIEIIIDTVLCTQSGSCQDATFITGTNVRINNFICALPDSCNNCLIKTDINDIGTPCNPEPVVEVIEASPADPVDPATVDPNVAPVDPVVAVDPKPDVAIPAIPSIPSIPDPVPPVDPVAADPIPDPQSPVDPVPPVDAPPVDNTIPSIPSIPKPDVPPADVAPVDQVPPVDVPATPIDNQQPTPDVVPSDIAPIPDLPNAPPAVPKADTSTIDVQQTGGAPAPPQVDVVPVDPITDPVIPVVQTGGIVVETGNTNTNNNGAIPPVDVQPPPQAGSGAIVPPSLV